MKYKTLNHKAKQIDHLIDHTIHSRGTLFITQDELKTLITKNFADFYVKSYGWHKIVFGIRAVDHKIVLKVGTKRSIENDHRAYKRVPESARHQLFAKIFWHTKYCLLQEYGLPAQVTPLQLSHLRRIVYKYGISDIKVENIKSIDGQLKIIDANITPFPLPTVWRILDQAKPKLPKRLTSTLRKISKLRDFK